MTQAKRDKLAFVKFMHDFGVHCIDLTTNDNRSQRVLNGRNLDFQLSIPSGRQCLVELEGRQCPVGRIQPSLAWIKGDELNALIDWEREFPRKRFSVIVWAFRDDDAQITNADIDYGRQRFVFRGVSACAYKDAAIVRSQKWETLKLSPELFATMLLPIPELLGFESTSRSNIADVGPSAAGNHC